MFLLEFFIAYGVWSFLVSSAKNAKLKAAMLCLAVVFSFIFYIEDYLFASHVKFPEAMSYGWRDTVNQITAVKNNYQSVHIEQGGQAQSMVSFYQKTDPNIFQKNSLKWQEKIKDKSDIKYLDQLGDYWLEDFRFKSFSWPEDISPDILYVARNTGSLPTTRRTIKKITTPQGKTLFEIFDFPKI